MLKLLPSPRYPKILFGVFVLYWLAWAYKPWFFQDWLLENVLTVAFVTLLVTTRRRFPLSNISYTLIFVHLCLHTIGAHYTYEKVPYDEWFKGVFGVTLNSLFGFERNHYDRLLHFLFGLLLVYPIREVFVRIVNVKGFWSYYLPWDVTISFSVIFEFFEWGAAEIFGGDLGVAYLGTQGDVWDAHKDMLLATVGGLITMCVVAFINWKFNRRFADEIAESLSVKQKTPLGEHRIRKWFRRKKKDNAPL